MHNSIANEPTGDIFPVKLDNLLKTMNTEIVT